MNRLSIWTGNTVVRKWQLEHITKKYYSEYFYHLKDKKILEIGCGSGWGTKMILKYFSPQKIIASDLDSRQIALAKKSLAGEE